MAITLKTIKAVDVCILLITSLLLLLLLTLCYLFLYFFLFTDIKYISLSLFSRYWHSKQRIIYKWSYPILLLILFFSLSLSLIIFFLSIIDIATSHNFPLSSADVCNFFHFSLYVSFYLSCLSLTLFLLSYQSFI